MARILFDLDGALVDGAPTIARAANALLAELGRAPVPVARIVGFVGHGMAALVEGLGPMPPLAALPGLVAAPWREGAPA